MVEAGEIQIMITAVDNMTAVLNKIERTLEKGNKNIISSTEKTVRSFQDQVSSLIAVGNAVNAVDRIMSSYQNLQLRLENATERVAGAQDRLADAQYNLNKAMKDGTKSAEDVAQAQRQVESASRSLQISQNNLVRAQNQVIGTYIQMGLGVAQLIQSLPTLIKWIRTGQAADDAWAISKTILLGLTNPLILAIGLAAAAAGVYAIKTMQAKESVDEFNISSGFMISSSGGVQDSLQGEADKYKELAIAAHLAASGVLTKINADIEQQKLIEKIAKKQTVSDMQPYYVPSAQDIAGMQAVILKDMAERLEQQANNPYNNPANQRQPGESPFTLRTDPVTGKTTKVYSDFISRPGQSPISFSSDDTIVGMKDIGGMRGGMYITIEGNVYGTDPDEMAEALYDKLRRKINF